MQSTQTLVEIYNTSVVGVKLEVGNDNLGNDYSMSSARVEQALIRHKAKLFYIMTYLLCHYKKADNHTGSFLNLSNI